jgi:hypothetical protein
MLAMIQSEFAIHGLHVNKIAQSLSLMAMPVRRLSFVIVSAGFARENGWTSWIYENYKLDNTRKVN